MARIPPFPVASAVDLGCGTGELTSHLSARWPEARVVGVDISEEMLAAAAARANERLRFERGDIATWNPESPVDLIVSNAALHWVADHAPLIDRLVAALAPGGVLAVQMPANFDAASHLLMAETAADGPWAEKLEGKLRSSVHALSWYAEHLLDLGLLVDAWETVYFHMLPGDDAVLAWVRGTALRPVLDALDEAERARFIAEYAARLRAAYPRGSYGTLFPFRRIFFVAKRP